jgi:hypothetical protein
MIAHHQAAQRDLRQLQQLCDGELDRTDSRYEEIERNYNTLYEGSRHLFETYKSHHEVTGEWLRTHLVLFAIAAQEFTQGVRGMIKEKNTDGSQNAAIQAVTMARTAAVLAFLQTAQGECHTQRAIYQRSLEVKAGKQRATEQQLHQNSPPTATESEPAQETQDQHTARIIAEAFQTSRQDQDSHRSNQRLKLVNPTTYDGKPTTPFRPWWESVKEFMRFYPQTAGFRRIIWVGTLLTNEALEWHQARRRDFEEDTWEEYSNALQKEYLDPHEAGQALQKMWALRYKGDIKAYLTSFRAQNRLAKSTGEAMQDMVNRALPTELIHMRFARSAGTFTNDEAFLQATFEAGRQVEMEKNVIKRHEMLGSQSSSGNSKGSGKAPKGQGMKESKDKAAASPVGKGAGTKRWDSMQEALASVPEKELADHRKIKDGCIRCGRTGHRCVDCYAKTTVSGTTLSPPPAIGKDAVGEKRKRDSSEAVGLPRKQAKVAAVTVDTNTEAQTPSSIWAVDSDHEEDF